jgi:hypothetical protein
MEIITMLLTQRKNPPAPGQFQEVDAVHGHV